MSARRKPPVASASTWPGRRSIAVAVGALIVAALVWHSTRETLEAASTHVAAPVPRPTSSPGRVAALPPPPVAPYAGNRAGLGGDDPVTAYRKANVYPPSSRPLTKDQLDLLEPNRRQESLHATDRNDGVKYLFTADRYFVIGDQALTATLDVERDGKPIPATISQSYAVVLDPVRHQEPPIPVIYAPSGARFVAAFAPAKLNLPRQAAISMYIEFDYGAGKQIGHFDFQYTPATGIPARFTGQFSDAVDAGSLVIHAGVEVTTPGRYVIDANLFDADNQPVAWSRFKGEFTAGSHDADLLYFGKVILDGNAHGPFHIGQLRGSRYAPDRDPDLEQMPPYAGTYTTKPYTAEQFSDAEYDSAEKQRMLELLGNDTSHRGGAGHAPPAPTPAP